MRLDLTVRGPLDSSSRGFTHSITFDPVQRTYTVHIGETDLSHRTSDAAAAVDIYCRFYAVPLAAVSDLRFPARIEITAALAAEGSVGFDSRVLWDYRVPHFQAEFSGLRDCPPGGDDP